MKIREKKNKLLGVPIMCSNTAKDYQNFLPNVRQEKNTEPNGSRELLLERDARKTASAKHIGGEPTRDRTPRNRSPTQHLAAGNKSMDTISCQERRGTALQTTEREGTKHSRITASRRRAVTFPRTACCLARDQAIDSDTRIPKGNQIRNRRPR